MLDSLVGQVKPKGVMDPLSRSPFANIAIKFDGMSEPIVATNSELRLATISS